MITAYSKYIDVKKDRKAMLRLLVLLVIAMLSLVFVWFFFKSIYTVLLLIISFSALFWYILLPSITMNISVTESKLYIDNLELKLNQYESFSVVELEGGRTEIILKKNARITTANLYLYFNSQELASSDLIIALSSRLQYDQELADTDLIGKWLRRFGLK
jgi:c-di-AMP phosphodiesterase-like protein